MQHRCEKFFVLGGGKEGCHDTRLKMKTESTYMRQTIKNAMNKMAAVRNIIRISMAAMSTHKTNAVHKRSYDIQREGHYLMPVPRRET